MTMIDQVSASARWTGTTGRVRFAIGRLIADSWILATASLAVLQYAHQDVHEHNELPAVLHWIRDGALAVPAAAIAVVVGTLIIARSSLGASPSTVRTRLVWVGVTAVLFALLSIPGNQLHGFLFGAEEEGVSWIQDALFDAALALVSGLVALIAMALLTGVPWHSDREADA